ncbi:hypothetical protein CEXT_624361 [Caerostris extrusa]|uniref:Uncharacterized protein n=1 Tax=Caerostris extrusa TaxID=172846 RepID=A0AAV4TF50_CAEEX|nr:hypothetical protein CEXT_624361 [Caerostris extrusa]
MIIVYARLWMEHTDKVAGAHCVTEVKVFEPLSPTWPILQWPEYAYVMCQKRSFTENLVRCQITENATMAQLASL